MGAAQHTSGATTGATAPTFAGTRAAAILAIGTTDADTADAADYARVAVGADPGETKPISQDSYRGHRVSWRCARRPRTVSGARRPKW